MDEAFDAAATVGRLRHTFNSGRCRPLANRKAQLNALMTLLEVEEGPLVKAMKEDLSKSEFETILLEIEVIRNAVRGMLYDLDDWAKDEPRPKSVVTLLDKTYLRSEPLGVVLVIGAWNYPLQLTLVPMAGAIAAGNCILLKPSELAPKVSATLKLTIGKHLDPDVVAVQEGDATVCSELLKMRFDHIFFTGGLTVGRIVARAAAENLTPCTLELGGKSPTIIVGAISDMMRVAMRIVWGKCANLGQTCVAPDYILCSEDTEKRLVPCLRQAMADFFGLEPKKSPDLARIVSDRHFDRLKRMVEGTKADLVLGGECDPEERFLDLHVYSNVEPDDVIMREEIFGPILPIVRVRDAAEAAAFVRSREKPLTLYVFSEDQRAIDTIVDGTSSGSVCINDVVVHLSLESLPFGGVGQSGYGNYHGDYTFNTFSHKKSVLQRDLGWIGEKLGEFRYPPYSNPALERGDLLLRRRNLPSVPFRAFAYMAFMGLGAALAVGCSYLAKA